MAAEKKASATGRVVAWGSSGRVAWSPRDVTSLTKTGFLGNPIGFRAVKVIAEAAAALPLILQDEGTRYDLHPLLDLIRNPNAAQGKAELFEAIYGYLLLSGNAYIEAVPGASKLPGELHVLRSDRMNVVPGADGWPVAYDYVVAGGRIGLRCRRITARFAISNPFTRRMTITACHRCRRRRWRWMCMAAHRPGRKPCWTMPHAPRAPWFTRGADGMGTLTTDQYDRLVGELEAHHQGARNAGRPMLLEGGLDWKPMGFSPSDMEFHETKQAAAREIAIAFACRPC